MFVTLQQAVNVRIPGAGFINLPAGTKVNYGCTKRDGKEIHTFTAGTKSGPVTYIEVTEPFDPPAWLSVPSNESAP